jgi:hypothetical protein
MEDQPSNLHAWNSAQIRGHPSWIGAQTVGKNSQQPEISLGGVQGRRCLIRQLTNSPKAPSGNVAAHCVHDFFQPLMTQAVDAQRTLVERLADPTWHGPQCHRVRLVETHISYVLLTGTFAYKIKKAVKLGFLDFTTLAARRFFCQEEIRLNRRLAPSLYLDVVAICGTLSEPRWDRSGPAIEYAVRMREFPEHALLPAAIARGAIDPEQIGALAERIAAFHGSARRALPHTRHGTPADVLELAIDNFRDLAALETPALRPWLTFLEGWTRREFVRLEASLERRRRQGRVRECHGDLHLGNIAMIEGTATPFDCIEFNERMRWSDVMSDAAFLSMDLGAHGRADLADRFLNCYFEESGDYDGARVLRFFVVYRAMVRAKVAMLRAGQTPDVAGRAAQQAAAIRFLRIAAVAARAHSSAIVIMHGFSGSGKTTVARQVAAALDGVQLRADVERKRLFGLGRLARTGATLAAGIYSAEATRQTYERLASLARTIVESGYVAIVDASFLSRRQRDRFRGLAQAAGLPFVIVDCTAPIRIMVERIGSRAKRADDASEADRDVLVHQIETADPLAEEERQAVAACDTSTLPSWWLPRPLIDNLRERLREADDHSPRTVELS